jgi:hypothetical protein
MQHSSLTRRAVWMTLSAAALLISAGCGVLDMGTIPTTGEPKRSGDGGAPYLVVTVGGSAAVNPTPSVAETIPESTPLPRIQLPTPDPNATPRPVASPSINLRGGTPAQRAVRPSDNLVPLASPVAASP